MVIEHRESYELCSEYLTKSFEIKEEMGDREGVSNYFSIVGERCPHQAAEDPPECTWSRISYRGPDHRHHYLCLYTETKR